MNFIDCAITRKGGNLFAEFSGGVMRIPSAKVKNLAPYENRTVILGIRPEQARSLLTTKKDVILAGGLHPGNVEDAILRVRPGAVDANSGLKNPDGSLNEYLAREFVRKAKNTILPPEGKNLPE